MTTNRTQLGLESLETREVLSTYYSVDGGRLTFTGDSANDYIEIRHGGTTNLSSVEYRYSPTGAWNRIYREVNDIYVVSGAGQDTVIYTQTENLRSGLSRYLGVNLGDQDDVFTATVNGSVGGLTGSNGQKLGLSIWVGGGNGNDRLTGTLNGDVLGDGYSGFTFHGERGIDFLTVNATNDVDIATNAVLDVRLFGGEDHGNVQFHYRGELDGLLTPELVGGYAYDWVVADLTLDSGSQGRLGREYRPAIVDGGYATDDVEFRLRDNSVGGVGVRAFLYGGGGTDRLTVSLGVILGDWQSGEQLKFV